MNLSEDKNSENKICTWSRFIHWQYEIFYCSMRYSFHIFCLQKNKFCHPVIVWYISEYIGKEVKQLKMADASKPELLQNGVLRCVDLL